MNKTELTLIGHRMGAIVLNELLRVYPLLPYRNIVYMAAASSISDFYGSIIPLIIQYEERLKLDIRTLEREITFFVERVAFLRKSRKSSQDEEKIREIQNEINKRTAELRKIKADLEKPGKGLTFYSLMLHPLAEKRKTFLGGVAPRGSLLEWIDTMYKGPNTMFDRTFGKWRNVSVAKHLFPDKVQERMLFRVFNLNEGNQNPKKHAEFNDGKMKFWCRQFWTRPDFKWGEKKDSRDK